MSGFPAAIWRKPVWYLYDDTSGNTRLVHPYRPGLSVPCPHCGAPLSIANYRARCCGQGLESNGGLVYMRNRWYDPNVGRFTQEDPIGYAGGINLYAYVGNNPVSYTDPFGLCPPELTGRPCQNMLGGMDLALRSDVPSGFGVIPERAAGFHQGADYLAPVGTTVTAADAGTVDRVGNDPNGFGHYIQLAHKNDQGQVVSYTLYAHLKEAPTLSRGDAVDAGAAIGVSGQSGNAAGTPAHLHFEIRTQSFPGRGLGDRCDPVKAVGGEEGACQ